VVGAPATVVGTVKVNSSSVPVSTAEQTWAGSSSERSQPWPRQA
jgi:hypothetical protein